MNTEPRPFSTTSGRGLFDELAADHGRILELLDSLTGGADAPDKEREQKRLGEQLSIEESKHEALEELFFWPLVRSVLDGGDQLAAMGLEQERHGKSMLVELDHTSAGSQTFSTLIRDALSKMRDHIAYEENVVWPKLRLALSPEELDVLGSKVRHARALAPTRPHPHVPPQPAVLGSVGSVIAMGDRALDKASGRGGGVQGVGRLRLVAVVAGVCSAAASAMLVRRHRLNAHPLPKAS